MTCFCQWEPFGSIVIYFRSAYFLLIPSASFSINQITESLNSDFDVFFANGTRLLSLSPLKEEAINVMTQFEIFFVNQRPLFWYANKKILNTNIGEEHGLLFIQTVAQIVCSKRMLKFALKFTCEVLLHVSVFHIHYQGATICALLKL